MKSCHSKLSLSQPEFDKHEWRDFVLGEDVSKAIINVDETQRQLANMENIEDVVKIKNMADAAQLFYKTQDDYATSQKAKEVSMRSIRRAGEILGGVPREDGKRTDLTSDGDRLRLTKYQRIIDDAGIGESTAKEWQKIAKIPDDKFESYFPDREYYIQEYSIADLMRFAGKWYQGSDVVEWETPQWLFDLLDKEFHFNLDVCATPENAKCSRFFTEESNGLAQDWDGICWMNPPYGKYIPAWVEKAHRSSMNGATVVCLVPSRTDPIWWWDYCIKGEIRFLKGRLKFGEGENSAPFPSAIIVFSSEIKPKVIWWNASESS